MANRYVHPTSGSNGNPGTEAQPWLTIAYAKTQLAAGDTLYLRGGADAASRLVYNESNTFSAAASVANGTSGSRITITNYPGEFIEIRPVNGSIGLNFDDRDYWDILGDTTDDPDDTGSSMNFRINLNQNSSNGYGPYIQNGSTNIRVRYVEIDNGACNPGMLQIRNSHNNTVAYCRIHDHVAAVGVDRAGIYVRVDTALTCDDNIFEYNTIFDCAGDGIIMEFPSGSRGINRPITRYNHIYLTSDFYTANGAAAENAIDDKDSEGGEYYGNVLHGYRYTDLGACCSSAGGSLVNLHQQIRDVSFHDNVLYDFVGMALYLNAGGNVDVYRNLIYDPVDDSRLPTAQIIQCARTVAAGNVYHRIYHNTIYGRANNVGARLIRLEASVVATITNNIFHTTGNISLGTGATLTASYNCWYNCLATQSGTGDVTSDPLFNSITGDDYRLTASSPCINAGTDLGSPYSTGYIGAAPDMGYFEYGAVTGLAFGSFPSSGQTATNLSTFTVSATRYDGTVDTTYSTNVVISKQSGPGTLSGTTTRTPSSGVATYNDIQLSSAGTYTTLATSGSFSQVSNSVEITSSVPPVELPAAIGGMPPPIKARREAVFRGRR